MNDLEQLLRRLDAQTAAIDRLAVSIEALIDSNNELMVSFLNEGEESPPLGPLYLDGKN